VNSMNGPNDNHPPHEGIPANLEAEASVLGSCLLNPDALTQAADLLTAADFYRERNGWVFDAMLRLHERREPPDLVLLSQELERMGRLSELGGPAYLTELLVNTPSALYVGHYASLVREAAQRRRIITIAGQFAAVAYDRSKEISEVMEHVETLFFQLAHHTAVHGMEHISLPLERYIEQLNQVAARNGAITGIPTGFAALDRVLGGFHRSDLVILAARPAMGKTSLAFTFALTAARRYAARVAVFSLEMSEEQAIGRWLSMASRIDNQQLRLAELDESEWVTLVDASNDLSALPIYIDDTAGSSMTELRSRARRIYAEHGLDLIIVDYLQLIAGQKNARSENRHQEISRISKGLKALAKELNVPVIALSQLSRDLKDRADKRPQLWDLKESGSIEEDADVVLFVHRDDYYDPDTERQNIVDLIVAKHRHGATGTVYLWFNKELTTFSDLEIQRTDLNGY
jgi:replicative DNA helicase